MRTVIIGDIHGCYSTLVELLRKIEYSPADKNTILIFLGDYIDRGPKIRETLDYLIKLKISAGNRVIFLRGNHEDMLLHVDADRVMGYSCWENPERGKNGLIECYDQGDIWMLNGGRETLKQVFSELEPNEMTKYLRFFRSLRVDYRETRFVCTHAGLVRGIAEDDTATKVWNRDFRMYAGKKPLVICGHNPVKLPIHSGKNGYTEYNFGREVYPLMEEGMFDIDTGAVFGYKLTAMLIEGEGFRLISQQNCE